MRNKVERGRLFDMWNGLCTSSENVSYGLENSFDPDELSVKIILKQLHFFPKISPKCITVFSDEILKRMFVLLTKYLCN